MKRSKPSGAQGRKKRKEKEEKKNKYRDALRTFLQKTAPAGERTPDSPPSELSNTPLQVLERVKMKRSQPSGAQKRKKRKEKEEKKNKYRDALRKFLQKTAPAGERTPDSPPSELSAGEGTSSSAQGASNTQATEARNTQPASVAFVLTYFNVRGRAEPIRLMLKDQGKEWTEITVTMEMWQQGALRESCLFGQVPKFQDGDLTLYQTSAIRRHLARKFGVYGKDDKEASLIDMMDDSLQDLQTKYFTLIFQNYDTHKENYIKELPRHLAPYEKILACNKGGFLVGKQISFADYLLLVLLQYHQVLSPTALDNFPALQTYRDKLSARPNIKAYMESDAFRNRAISPNAKH